MRKMLSTALMLMTTLATASCGLFDRHPPCSVTVKFAGAPSDAANSETVAVLARRIDEMAGSVSEQTRTTDGITLKVDNCPPDKALLRATLLSPGKFQIALRRGGPAWITEADIIDAQVTYDPAGGEPNVAFRLNSEATQRFAQHTAQAVGEFLQIKWDGKVLNEPVLREPISGGNGQFGPMSLQDAMAVVTAIRSGPLPVGIQSLEISEAAKQ